MSQHCPLCGEESDTIRHIVEKHSRGMIFSGSTTLILSIPVGKGTSVSYLYEASLYEQFVYIDFIDVREFGKWLVETIGSGYHHASSFLDAIRGDQTLEMMINNGKYKCCIIHPAFANANDVICDYVYEDGLPSMELVRTHIKN